MPRVGQTWRSRAPRPRRANAPVRSDAEDPLAQGALEALLQVGDRFRGGTARVPTRERIGRSAWGGGSKTGARGGRCRGPLLGVAPPGLARAARGTDGCTAVVNSRGGGPLYSSLEIPMLLLPLIAWAG